MMILRVLACLVFVVAGSVFSPQAEGAHAALELQLSRSTIHQGDVAWVTVRSSSPVTQVRLRFAGRFWPLYAGGAQNAAAGQTWRTIVGTDPTTSAGRKIVVAEAVTPSGARVNAQGPLTVTRVAFARRRITFDRARQALLTPQAAARERRLVNEALRVLSTEQLWTGTFARPVEGTTNSGYGVLSIYQNVVRGFHGGTDFPAAEGTSVMAPADGIVRLAAPLPLSGNAVMIDHGLGVVSSYLHLSEASVRVGQRVKKGEQIGRVGSSGLATGPHLHWGLRVNGVSVDPTPWTR